MQRRGTRYQVKHSGQFLYKISNEEDIDRFKVTKIPMPSQIAPPRLKLEASSVRPERSSKDIELVNNFNTSRLGKQNEIAPVSNYLGERDDFLLPFPMMDVDAVTGL